MRLGAAVAEVTPRSVVFKDGEELPYGFCVWAGGNGPLPLVLDTVGARAAFPPGAHGGVGAVTPRAAE